MTKSPTEVGEEPTSSERESPKAGTSTPNLGLRLAIAAAVGVVAWALSESKLRSAGPYFIAGDFTWHWRAADALLRGLSPYKVINTTPVYPFSGGYPYFLSTPLVLLPFGKMSPAAAMALFSGLSIAVLAFALMRNGLWRLPILLSVPVYWSATTGQLTVLIVAAMLVPSLGWLAPMKFTIGAAGAAYNLSRRYVLLAMGIVLVSVAIWPWWPNQWLAELSDVPGRWYHVPILVPGGVLILVALLRWRRPEARLVAAMACIPQTMLFYDQLPLALVARNRREALAVALWSWAGPGVAILLHGNAPIERGLLFAQNAPIIVFVYYIPALVAILFRPNVGNVPRWLERTLGWLPAWLQGSRPGASQAP